MASFRGGNMACKSWIVDPDTIRREIDYSDLLIAQKGLADKFKPALDCERLIEVIKLDDNRRIYAG